MSASVLIVDESEWMRALLKNLLKKEGYRLVGEARTVQEAFVRCEEQKPDLVIMDGGIQGDDSIEWISKMVSLNPSSKIIVCSPNGSRSNIKRAINAGASDYLVRPIFPERFALALRNVMSGLRRSKGVSIS